MGDVRPEMYVKGRSAEQTDRLKRFTKSLNAELVLFGGESIDVLEAHEEYQGLIDDHEGTLADLVRTIAAERTSERYVEEEEEEDDPLDELEQAEQEEEKV
jgi:hypothetical protein